MVSLRPLVLFVDDDGDILETVWALLKAELPHVNVLVMQGPEAALRAVEATYPDVLIADFRMPVMDGLTFLQEASRGRPPVPMILTTGAPASHFAERAKAIGVTEVLRKPFQPEAMIQLLVRHVGRMKPIQV